MFRFRSPDASRLVKIIIISIAVLMLFLLGYTILLILTVADNSFKAVMVVGIVAEAGLIVKILSRFLPGELQRK